MTATRSRARRLHSRAATILGCITVAGALLVLIPQAGHAQTEVRDVDNPAFQPFQAELAGQPIPVIQEANDFQVATVPLGKRLVIEHVSLRVAGGERQSGEDFPFMHALAFLETTANGTRVRHELAVNRVDLRSFNRNISIVSQPIRVYADAGSAVRVQIAGAAAARDAILVRLAISGYLIDRIEARPVPQER